MVTEGAECRYPRVFEFFLLGQIEKFHIPGIGPRPAAFDVMYAEIIQAFCDLDFFLGTETDIFSLGPIPQGRVIKYDLFHLLSPTIK